MDYIIEFIGIILLVIGGTTPNVNVDTAFLPVTARRTFCASSARPKQVDLHTAFIRIANSSIVPDQTNWPDKEMCEASQQCTLFPITVASELTIDSGFQPAVASARGGTFCLVPRLGEIAANPRLVDHPEDISISLKLPGGALEAGKLRNRAVFTSLRVPAPPNAPRPNITIRATPRPGQPGDPKTLVVRAGTRIQLLNLPRAHAGMELDHNDPPAPDNAHYYLFNALLPADRLCSLPAEVRPNCTNPGSGPGVEGDPSCSNNGCCP